MQPAHDVQTQSSPPSTPLGRYRILQSLGQGGMAEVTLAVMPGPARFNKLMVIKTIREDIEESGQQYAEMFLDEARLAARLSHPNVVQTYEVGEDAGTYFIAMEYLEGQSLRAAQRQIKHEKMPLEVRLRILIEVAQGLHHAHELTDFSGNSLQVVHRDVSPQNIFLTYDGQVKLLDFGIAKARDADCETRVGQIKGKIDYMAPEQVKSELVDRRADVFALGAIMWELLAGKQRSGGRKVSEVTRVHNRVLGKEPGIREVVPDIDDELARICERALAQDFEDRYETALDFARDLQTYLANASLVATPDQLAQLLDEEFADKREQMRRQVEAALAAVEEEGVHPDGPMGSDVRPTVPPPSRSVIVRRPDLDGSEPDITLATQSMTVTRLRSRARPMFIFGAMVLAAGLAGWGPGARDEASAVDVPVDPNPPAAQLSPDLASAEQQPQPQAAAAPTFKLRITATTPGIRVTLDGVALSALPFEAEVQTDKAMHRLVATAPGHETLSQLVVFDGDKNIELSLKRTPAAPKRNLRKRVRPRIAAKKTTAGGAKTVAQPQEAMPGDKLHSTVARPDAIDAEDPYL